MSKTVDSRVVEMRFDNKNFESNVADTMSSIDKLNQKLQLKGATKGLEDIDAASKKVDMSGMGTAVEAVQAKFSALQVMAVTALANITNSAVNAGKRIVSALTIDPIKTGFSEYETKINAIQTIMSNTSSKGTTMEDVTRVIGELNTYADKTIYNFAEMTRNIGTFTAAGVGLEESASAIQGIANLAAASGSTSQQASTAMYQLSQALAAGSVKLMDWNSVVNAGMGGEKFQEALKATARDHGVAIDNIIKKNGSFRESLQEGWITADILNETLRKFTVEGAKEYAQSMIDSGKWTKEQADALIKEAQAMEDAATKVKTFTQLWDTLKESAQSGWSQTWEIIVGDFEEAKETLTKFSDIIGGMIGASADARNELLQGWKDAGGRADLLDSLFNVFNGIMEIVKPIKEAFREIFPPTTVEQLVGFTKGLKELTAKFKVSDETAAKLKRTFKGVFAVIDIVRQIVVAVVKAFASLFGVAGDLGGGILSVTAAFGDWLVKLNESIKKSKFFTTIFETLATIIKRTFGVIKNVSGWLKEQFIAPMLEVGQVAGKMGSGVSSAMDSISSAIKNSNLFKILQSVWNGIVTITKGIFGALNSMVGGLFDKIGNGDFQGVLDFFNALISGGIGIGIMKFIKSITNITDSFGGFGDILEGITDVLDGAKGCFTAWQNDIKAGTLQKIAIAVGILAAALLVLAMIDQDKLTSALGAITVLFIELIAAMSAFSKLAGPEKGVVKSCTAMISMSLAVLILASALKKIGDLDFDQLTIGLIGIAAMMTILVATAKAMQSDGKTVVKGAMQMLIMATALKILASACLDIASLGWQELFVGLTGIFVLINLLTNAAKALQTDGKTMVKGAMQMLIMATALKVLASACLDISSLSWEELATGLTGILVLTTALVLAAKALQTDGSTMVKGAMQMLIMSAALKIMASVCADLGALNWVDLAQGLIGIAAMLGALVGACVLLSKFVTKAMSGAVAMAIMGAALKIVASACMDIAGMSWPELVKGLVGVTAALGVMLATLILMSKFATGALSGAAAIMVVALALRVLIPVLIALGSMSWGSIAKGLITVAAALAIIGVAAALLKPVVPAMLGMAAALALIGIAAVAFGAGLLMISAGISAFAVSLTALVSSLGVICTGIISIIRAIIVGICEGIADGIVAFCGIIIDGIPAIGEAIKVVILTLCDVLVECTPVIADTILKVIVGLLDALVTYGPTIIGKIFDFIIGIINGIAERLPDLIQAVVNVFMSLFSGVLESLGNIDFATLVKGMGGIGIIAGVIAALAAITPLIPGAMLGVLGMGAVIAELAIVLGAIGALASIPGLTWLVDEGAQLLQSIGQAIGGFVGGIVGGVAEGVTSSLPQIGQHLSDFMTNVQPFIDGIKQIDASVAEGVETLVGVVLALTGANIINGLTSWVTGGSSLTKFGEELAAFGPYFRSYADSISGINPAAIVASSVAAESLARMTSTIPNEGGMVAWFTGENSISKFGSELPALGKGLKGFSDSVAGVVPENIIAAANAAIAISKMTATIPNEGGMVAWFTGENSIAKFGSELPMLGAGLKAFSVAVTGIVPENVIGAADAAKALAEMANVVPNEGGVVAWFTGENALSKFGADLAMLGIGLRDFSISVAGIVPENLTAAIEAAKALAEMSQTIPNEGGMVAWFTGDNSLSKFGTDLISLGMGLKGFSESVTGIVPENVMAGANAAKAIAEMANIIPNEGGVVSWFTGDNSLSKFANQFPKLGTGLKGFSDSLMGVVPENIVAGANAAKAIAEMANVVPNEGGIKAWFTGENSLAKFGTSLISLGLGLRGFATATVGIAPESVTAAAGAAKSLAEMANVIPNEGGVKAWFTGENSIANFGSQLTSLGMGLKGFAIATTGIVPESISAASSAAKSLAEMAAIIPNEGGVAAWFTGESSIAHFGSELVSLGMGLKGFAIATTGIVPENITAAAGAAKSLADMTSVIPKEGGIKAWFTGESSIAKFAGQLPELGSGLSGFSKSVAGINPENVTAAASAAKSLADMTNTVPKKTDKIVDFGKDLEDFGDSLKSYFSKTAKVSGDSISASKSALDAVKEASSMNSGNLESVADAIDDLVDSIKGMSKIKSDVASNFRKALKEIGETGAEALLKPFEKVDSDMKKAGKKAMEAFIEGVKSKASAAKKACKNLADDCADALESKQSAFKTAGKNLVKGFANGISSNSYTAVAKAKAMAKAAADAAKKALGIASPSKVFYKIGGYTGEGFINALIDYADKSYTAGTEMAGSAKSGLRDAIGKISDVINGDMDTQPTIRPVLDLSNVKSGAGLISSMLGTDPSVGVLAKVGAISSLMQGYNQNGANDELVSAIDKLRKDLGKVGNTTYSINGVTYDDGSNITEAVKSIVRAARVERRM